MTIKRSNVPDQSIDSTERVISFGRFRLFPKQRLLLEAGKPVRLGGRALEVLTALVEQGGALVKKEELIARVWPDTFVEEVSLRVHVAAVRRALGDGQAGNRYIENIPGRGYRFIAPVSSLEGDQTTLPEAIARARDLPPFARVIGRNDIISKLVTQILQRRLITIAGPGGIGKTTVALAVAESLGSIFNDGTRFIDLASLTDPSLVPTALASVLGLAIRSADPMPGLISYLQSKRTLLLLDSCEHVIDAVAALVKEILKGAAHTHMLATSREPLRVGGEFVQRLLPLGIPPESPRLTAAEALNFPAVQLFVERAAESVDGFELSDSDAARVTEICHKLDGNALAIELAAGRVNAFGVTGLAALLSDRIQLLTNGPRSAVSRHKTLSAMLDWSYDFLSDPERIILRRLAIFAGEFGLEAAIAVVGPTEIAERDVIDQFAHLIEKSLITADVSENTARYRLLDTTRAYALAKLTESGESVDVARRHAEYHRNLLEREAQRIANLRSTYGRQIDNVRSALDWAFSLNGDQAIGVALTLAAVPLWTYLSLNEECRTRVQQALSSGVLEGQRDAGKRMQLSAALATALQYISMGPEYKTAWSATFDIAETLQDIDYKLRALWGLWTDSINKGQFRDALALAEQFGQVAPTATDRADALVAHRMIGFSQYLLGDLVGARRNTEYMLTRYVTPHESHIVRFGFDQRLTAQAVHAEVLWLLGFPERAMQAIENIFLDPRTDHKLSLSYALARAACPVALYVGDLAAAERYISQLNQPTAHAFGFWHSWGHAYAGTLLVKRGDIGNGLRILQTALREMPENAGHMRYTAFLGELADALGRAGEIDCAMETIEEALNRSERQDEHWCVSELLRIKAELVLLAAAPDSSVVAEEYLQRSLDRARKQQSLSWELRAATSLARLKIGQRQEIEARSVLAPVYDRFSEGLATADLLTAKDLLSRLPQ